LETSVLYYIMICTKCNIEKSVSAFSIRNRGTGKLHKQCKECHTEYRRKHYLKNKAKYIKKAKINNKVYKEYNRNKLFKYLTGKSCADCGETDPITLDFDHVKGAKKFAIPNGETYSWKTVLLEIDKCEIRCANCHRKRHAKENNTYRYEYFN